MDLIVKLKALSDANRLAILKLLLSKRYCVRALAKQLDVTEAAVSQHIRILRDAGFLTGQKQGYFTHYEVRREELSALATEIEALIQTPATEQTGKKCSGKPHCQCNSGKSSQGICHHGGRRSITD